MLLSGGYLDSALNHGIALTGCSGSTPVVLKEPKRPKDPPIAAELPPQGKSARAVQTLLADVFSRLGVLRMTPWRCPVSIYRCLSAAAVVGLFTWTIFHVFGRIPHRF